MNSLLESLNPPQKEAVLYFDGPLLVLAGAGSGKTKVLTHKIAHMIAEKMYWPDRILAVTFTNKAAGEMKERIAKLTGDVKIPWMGTFHSICVRILRQSGSAIGIQPSYTIYDRDDQIGVVKDVFKTKKIDDEQLSPSTVLARISKAKSRLESLIEFARNVEGPDDQIVAEVYREYQSRLTANGALDFDDLLNRTVDLFKGHQDVLDYWRDRFRYVLVDEFQDVNFAQHMLIQMLARHTGHVTAVGDDDQSIYSFRGSDVELILRFEKDYPGAHVVKLEQNYRCTGSILDMANFVIGQNVMRNNKVLWTSNQKGDRPVLKRLFDGRAEARYIAREMRRQQREWRRPWGDFAILYRTNAQSRQLEEAMIEDGVPYKMVGGLRFFERKEIKDLMGYLWVIVNPQDEVNLKRIINVPPRGIGTSTLHRLEEAAVKEKTTLMELVKSPAKVGDLTPLALAALREVASLLSKMATMAETHGVADVLKKLIDVSGYDDYLQQDGSPESQGRLANIEELVNLASEYQSSAEEPTVRNFLTEKALVSDVDSWDDKAGTVTLMTLHAAKGLEFPVVFLAGLEEDTFPSARSRDNPAEMEEERRLCYVGMTRAREVLFLTAAHKRRVYGEEMDRILSSFVRDLPELLVDVQEELNAEPEEHHIPRAAYSRGYDSGYSSNNYSNRPATVTRPVASSNSYTTPPKGVKTTIIPPKATSSRSTPSRTSAARTSGPVRSVSPSSVTSTVRRPPPPPPVEVPPPFKVGDHVKHKVFGIGTVDRVDKDVVQADFPGYGIKKIMATFLTMEGDDRPPGIDTKGLKPGDRIRHAQYGEGILKDIEYRNGHPHLVLMYPDEVRTFPVAGSPMEKV